MTPRAQGNASDIGDATALSPLSVADIDTSNDEIIARSLAEQFEREIRDAEDRRNESVTDSLSNPPTPHRSTNATASVIPPLAAQPSRRSATFSGTPRLPELLMTPSAARLGTNVDDVLISPPPLVSQVQSDEEFARQLQAEINRDDLVRFASSLGLMSRASTNPSHRHHVSVRPDAPSVTPAPSSTDTPSSPRSSHAATSHRSPRGEVRSEPHPPSQRRRATASSAMQSHGERHGRLSEASVSMHQPSPIQRASSIIIPPNEPAVSPTSFQIPRSTTVSDGSSSNRRSHSHHHNSRRTTNAPNPTLAATPARAMAVVTEAMLIASLPVGKVPETSPLLTQECQICFELFESGILFKTLPCLHKYHVECVDNWLARKPTCPICLNPLSNL